MKTKSYEKNVDSDGSQNSDWDDQEGRVVQDNAQNSSEQHKYTAAYTLDRRRPVVMDDAGNSGPACFTAVKILEALSDNGSRRPPLRRRVRAVAVREHGDIQELTLLLYIVLAAVMNEPETWIAVAMTE